MLYLDEKKAKEYEGKTYKELDKNKYGLSKDKKLVLTEEQQDAYDQISFMIENEEYAEFLLHGVTGSR